MYLFMLTNNQKHFGLANQALEKYLCMQCYEADKCGLHCSDVGKDNLKFLFIRAGTGTGCSREGIYFAVCFGRPVDHRTTHS